MPPMIAMAVGSAVSGASSSKGGKGPAGQVTNTGSTGSGDARPYIQDALAIGRGRLTASDADPSQLGAGPVKDLNYNTSSALDTIGRTATQGMGRTGVASANAINNQFINGDFSSSPGLSGLQRTASGYYLPGQATINPGNNAATMAGGAGSDTLGAGAASVSGSGNPYLDAIATRNADMIQSRVNNSNGNMRFGSGAHNAALADQIGGATNQLYGNAYAQERGLQQSAQGALTGAQTGAIGQAGALDTAQYIDPNAQLGVGQFWDNRALQQQNAGYDAFKNYLGILNGVPGGSSSTSSSPYFTNPLASILGSGIQGAQAGKGLGSLFSSPTQSSSPSTWGGSTAPTYSGSYGATSNDYMNW